jgi:hypothetical protein
MVVLLNGFCFSEKMISPLFWEFPWLFVPKPVYNEVSVFAIKRAMQQEPLLKVTIPNFADDGLIDGMF